uniref:EGF-like domain-containing protein n=1 Tax=Plectus sambesii TaxID=2011161 RepID=A0A914X1P0_9BILA
MPLSYLRRASREEARNERKCICLQPFTGRYCEDYICVNGISLGSQYDPESIYFNKRCLCDTGWTGPQCSVSIFNRCGENGFEDNGKCICNQNFVGERCQYVTKCFNGQLYNGRCACHYGWAGNFCDKIICHQGEADQTKKMCICPAKYRGKFCDFCAEPSSSPPPDCAPLIGHRIVRINSNNALIIAAAVLLVVSVLLLILLYLNRHNISRSKNALKKALKKATANIEQRLPNKSDEISPLNGDNQTINVESTANNENFYNLPPSPHYEALKPAEQVQKDQDVSQTAISRAETGALLSNQPKVSFFLKEAQTATAERAEQQDRTSNPTSDMRKSQNGIVCSPDKKFDNVTFTEFENNV